jgi:hypothetical protein
VVRLPRAAAIDAPGLYVLELDGGLFRVADEPELVANTMFSPDRLQISFGVADRLEVVNLDGSGRRTS